jgi:uncharacterized protein
MFWLFLFGVAHTLFWWGDVLHLYAVCGVLLLLFRNMRPRSILYYSLLFMFVIPQVLKSLLASPGYFNDENLSLLFEAYSTGTFIDIFSANLDLYYNAFIIGGGDLRDIAETLGRFLFGYYLVRLRFFDRLETRKNRFKRLLIVLAPLAFAYLIANGMTLYDMVHPDGLWWRLFMQAGILFTSCFYVCGLVLLYFNFGEWRVFTYLQALGRVTLTNYLLISACMVILLYGIGFGMLGALSMRVIWISALLWLVIEILFSILWLDNFRYGPLEWLWRRLTYMKHIRLRK